MLVQQLWEGRLTRCGNLKAFGMQIVSVERFMVTTNRNTGFAARAGQGDGGRGMGRGQRDWAG